MAEANASGKLYTLTEVSKRTKISMPTLQRYKKMFNDRIPSSGEGRSQRYPEAAIEIFNELKVENSKKRGRPRKNAAQGAAPRAAVKPAKAVAAKPVAEEKADPGMLSLKDIEDQTNISYPTLLRYLKTSLKRIPHKGSGRRRRFPPEAVAVFRTLKEESRRGRKAGSGKAAAAAKAVPTKAMQAKAGPAKPAAAAPAKRGRPKKVVAETPAPAAAPKRRGRPPKNPAAVAATSSSASIDAGLALQLRELTKTIAGLQKQVNKLELELQKPFKVVLKR